MVHLNLNLFSGHFSLTVGEKRSAEDLYQRLDSSLSLFPQQWRPKERKDGLEVFNNTLWVARFSLFCFLPTLNFSFRNFAWAELNANELKQRTSLIYIEFVSLCEVPRLTRAEFPSGFVLAKPVVWNYRKAKPCRFPCIFFTLSLPQQPKAKGIRLWQHCLRFKIKLYWKT